MRRYFIGIYLYLDFKRKKYQKIKESSNDNYNNKVSALKENKNIDTFKRMEQSNKYFDENIQDKKRCDEVIEKYNKKINFMYENIVILGRVLFCVVFIMFFLLMLIMSACIGGSFGTINKVENVCTEDIAIQGYYDIDYSYVDQNTLTVFVKNNSSKILESAKITESNTYSSEYIYALEPGQEKIITLDIYPNKEGSYEFQITDIKFKE